jgi:hypothetical protein
MIDAGGPNPECRVGGWAGRPLQKQGQRRPPKGGRDKFKNLACFIF